MASEPVQLGVITEIHIVPPGTPEGHWHNDFRFSQAEALFGNAVRRCEELGVDAIAILGDLTHFADPASFAVVRRVLEKTELPVYVLPGNHDLDSSERPLAAFQQAMDLPNVTIAPMNLALTSEIGLQLTGLEPGSELKRYAAVRSKSAPGGDVAQGGGGFEGTRGSSASVGTTGGAVWTTERVTVVLTHFPAFPTEELLAGAELKHAGDLVNRESFLATIEGISGPVLIVNGHLHVHATIADGRLLQLSVAALIEPPHDVTLLTIGVDQDGQPWVMRQASGLFAVPGVTLPVLSPRAERWSVVDGAWVAE